MLAVASAVAQAQVPPQSLDPLLLERQQRDNQRRSDERERLLAPPRRAIEEPVRPAIPPTPSTARFVLKAVDFGPSVFITPEELQALAAPYIDTEVDFGVINGLVDKVNALYAARGQAFSRAFLPPQRVDAGRIRINLVEARADVVEYEGLKYINKSWADRLIATEPGEVLDALRLDRTIDRYQRATDARFAIDVEPGKQTGTSTLKVNVVEPNRVRLRASLSNEGNDNTGREQATADVSLFSPLGLGDRIGLSAVTSQGLKSLNASFSTPLSPWGARLVYGLAAGRTHIINGPFAINDIRGESRSWNVQLAQPLYDNRPWSVESFVSYGSSHSNTSITGVDLGTSRLQQYAVGLQVSRRDDVNEWVALADWVPYRATAALGAVSQSSKLEWNASYVRRFEGVGAFLARANGQHTHGSNPLAGAGQLSWGGAGLLRAYPAGSLLGDSGYGISLEWHAALTKDIGWSVFSERGVVWGSRPRQSLTDVGAGLEWRASDTTSVNVMVAHGLNEGTITGAKNRIYVKFAAEF